MNLPITSLRDAQKALTRRRIISAARSAFEAKGYGGTSIGLITKNAAINRATFYLHFSDKAAVFREVISHENLQTDAVWKDLNQALLIGTREAIAVWLRRMRAWSEENALLMPSKHEAMAGDIQFAKEFQPRYDALAQEIGEYLEKFPTGQRESEKIRIQMLVVLADQMYFHVVVQKVWNGSETQLMKVLTDIWCNSLEIR